MMDLASVVSVARIERVNRETPYTETTSGNNKSLDRRANRLFNTDHPLHRHERTVWKLPDV